MMQSTEGQLALGVALHNANGRQKRTACSPLQEWKILLAHQKRRRRGSNIATCGDVGEVNAKLVCATGIGLALPDPPTYDDFATSCSHRLLLALLQTTSHECAVYTPASATLHPSWPSSWFSVAPLRATLAGSPRWLPPSRSASKSPIPKYRYMASS